jgi:hypothetical protein
MRRTPLAPLAPPVALAVAGAVAAEFRLDRGASSSCLFLSLLAAGVLSALALSARPRSAVVPLAALTIFGALVFLPSGLPLPDAAVGFVTALALGFALAERVRNRRASALEVLGLVFAAQLAAAGPRLFIAPSAPATLATLIAAPLAVGGLLAQGAARRPRAALALGLATFAAGPGWGALGVVAVAAGSASWELAAWRERPRFAAAWLVAAAALPWVPRLGTGPAWLAIAMAVAASAALAAEPGVARAGAATLAAAAVVALVAGSLPWRAPRPLAAALSGAVAGPPFAVVDVPVVARAVVLTAAHPGFEREIEVGPTRGVRVLSYLTEAVELPCATPVARVELLAGERPVAVHRLEIGRDTADWAAHRPDVARALRCPAPAPYWSWIPAAGRFFGGTYGSRATWPRSAAADRLRISRDPALPDRVGVAVFFVGVDR